MYCNPFYYNSLMIYLKTIQGRGENKARVVLCRLFFYNNVLNTNFFNVKYHQPGPACESESVHWQEEKKIHKNELQLKY